MSTELLNKDTAQNLKSSPIYKLSLSSLENFHTSFLTWIGNNYRRDFLSVFLEDSIAEQAKIEYEDQINYGKNAKIDLQIKITDGESEKLVIIENKLKSFPTNEQLNNYTNIIKNKDAAFILLSLAPKSDLPPQWQHMSYSELHSRLAQLFNSDFSYKNPYHKYLIEDYISVIGEISKRFPVGCSNKYDFYTPNEMDEIGLKDIYVKYRNTELADYFERELNGLAEVEALFNNKKGTISIYKKFENPDFLIGIQIEAEQYRYFLYNLNTDNQTRESIAEGIFDNLLWSKITKNPKGSRIYKNFCGYAPSFIYRYSTLDFLFGEPLENVTYEKILSLVTKDIKNIIANESKIKQIVNKHLAL